MSDINMRTITSERIIGCKIRKRVRVRVREAIGIRGIRGVRGI